MSKTNSETKLAAEKTINLVLHFGEDYASQTYDLDQTSEDSNSGLTI